MKKCMALIGFLFSSVCFASDEGDYNAMQHFRSYADPLELTVGLDHPVYFNESYYKVLTLIRQAEANQDEELVINEPMLLTEKAKTTRTGELSMLPAMLCTLRQLKCLRIYPPRDDIRHVALRHLKELPERIGELKQLETVIINGAGLVQLPVSFYGLKHITRLDLTDNQLEFLPDAVEQLQSLKDLRLGHNRLEHLNDEVGHLKNLEFLDVSHNELSELPGSLGQLDKLQTLIVSHNAIRQLPDLTKLQDLKTLNISHNKFTAIPEEQVYLDELTSFSFSHNQIASFSLSFIKMCDKHEMRFYGFTTNPLSRATLAKMLLSHRGTLIYQEELATGKFILGWTVELVGLALGLAEAHEFLLHYVLGFKNH